MWCYLMVAVLELWLYALRQAMALTVVQQEVPLAVRLLLAMSWWGSSPFW